MEKRGPQFHCTLLIPHEKLQEAVRLIREERERQVLEEGYTGHHDAVNGHENLVLAAATYEMEPEYREKRPSSWPWNYIHWKPTAHEGTKGRIRELQKAGALYMAAKAVMERKGLESPLKQAVCEKVDLMAEQIAGLLGKLDREEAEKHLTPKERIHRSALRSYFEVLQTRGFVHLAEPSAEKISSELNELFGVETEAWTAWQIKLKRKEVAHD